MMHYILLYRISGEGLHEIIGCEIRKSEATAVDTGIVDEYLNEGRASISFNNNKCMHGTTAAAARHGECVLPTLHGTGYCIVLHMLHGDV